MARMYNASQVLDMLQLDEDLDGNESDYPEDFETESDEEDVSDLDDNDNVAVNVNANAYNDNGSDSDIAGPDIFGANSEIYVFSGNTLY